MSVQSNTVNAAAIAAAAVVTPAAIVDPAIADKECIERCSRAFAVVNSVLAAELGNALKRMAERKSARTVAIIDELTATSAFKSAQIVTLTQSVDATRAELTREIETVRAAGESALEAMRVAGERNLETARANARRDLESVNSQLARANEENAALRSTVEELNLLKAAVRNASVHVILVNGVLEPPTVIGQCSKCNVRRGARNLGDHCLNCAHATECELTNISTTFTQFSGLLE